MRKQYHSRRTEEGQLIWDVHRLVELSKDFPVVEIRVEDIVEMDVVVMKMTTTARLLTRQFSSQMLRAAPLQLAKFLTSFQMTSCQESFTTPG